MSQFTRPQIEWINALESGAYEQGFGALYVGDGKFCCMGVACKVFNLESKPYNSDSSNAHYTYGGHVGFLPEIVASYLKINRKAQERLSMLNDCKKYSFKQIAEELRSHPELYFGNFQNGNQNSATNTTGA